MAKYLFDLGNSTAGAVGYVAEVEARNPTQAAKYLREAIPEGPIMVRTERAQVEIRVYLNPSCKAIRPWMATRMDAAEGVTRG